ncbi:MAG TPA: DUF3168 domain-containing protein [Dokdonella sp.]|nr:DUF3168 domain-containing protein [Dokdonella sp.]HNS27383.1 DUF3168 domain-containing protein [Steroidobacteraceae bacterium]
MNLPSLFPLIAADPSVTAFIGTSPVRFYPHGTAPQGVVAPYLTQFASTILPINTLDRGAARADSTLVQVSCWSDNGGDAVDELRDLAAAARRCIERAHHVEAVRDMRKDIETGRYRIDFDVRVFVHREDDASSSDSISSSST